MISINNYTLRQILVQIRSFKKEKWRRTDRSEGFARHLGPRRWGLRVEGNRNLSAIVVEDDGRGRLIALSGTNHEVDPGFIGAGVDPAAENLQIICAESGNEVCELSRRDCSSRAASLADFDLPPGSLAGLLGANEDTVEPTTANSVGDVCPSQS